VLEGLGDAAADSPIVEDNTVLKGFFAITCVF
jgi:hypothetical protein